MLGLQDVTTDAGDYENLGLTVTQAANAYAGPGSLSYASATGTLTYTGGPGGTSMTDLVLPIQPVDDSDFEYTESFEIFLTNPSSSTGGTVTVDPAQSSWTIDILDNDGTALDRYVAKPDATYAYSLVDTVVESGMTTYIIDMTSQTWRSAAEVDRPQWEHEVHIFVPDGAASATAILFIGSGDNGDPNQAIRRADAEEIAMHTGQITIYLPTVPNQYLTFTDDGVARREDGIMAYSFDKFLEGGDDEWPVLLPMVKSAIRAMDTAQEFLADNTAHVIDDFFVTGGSKRGWTTWLTAATDPRVTGIVPVVFDYLNSEVGVAYHEHIYDGVTEGTVGGYAEALSSYVEFDVFGQFGTPEMDALLGMIDPYEYRDRLTLPKYAVMSTGDQFMPMLSQFYIHDLSGPTYLRYTPNTGHSVSRASGKEFFAALDAGETLPVFDWSVEGASENVIRLNSTDTPVEVNLWQATNPDSLDFRIDYFGPGWTSTPLSDQGGGEYVGSVPVPASGGTGFFVEMKYSVGGEILTFTTEGRIVEAVEAGAEWSITSTSPTIAEDAAGTESLIISLSGTLAEGAQASVALQLQDITTDASDYEDPGLMVDQAVSAYTGPGSLSYDAVVTGVLTYTGGPGGTSMTDLVLPMLPVDDDLIEGDESLTVSLLNPTNAGLGQSQVLVTILDDDQPISIEGRYVFYNDSGFDGADPAANAADDAAIDTSKTAYLPGGGTSAFANTTGYTKGINGIMIDVAGLGNAAGIDAGDFVFKTGNNNSPSTWAAAPAPTAVAVRTGAGLSGSDRITITWADGAIANEWLEVQVLANADTGLPDNFGGGIGDVFFFGNKVADSDNLATDLFDVFPIFTVAHPPSPPVTYVYDYNKSGAVDLSDAFPVFANGGAIVALTVPSGGPFAPGGGEVSPATAGGGDAGLSSGLASSSSSEETTAPPAAVTAGLEPASSGTGEPVVYSQLLDAAVWDADHSEDEADLDDGLLDSLVAGISQNAI